MVVDPGKRTVYVYRGDDLGVSKVGETLTLPDVLPGFVLEIARLYR